MQAAAAGHTITVHFFLQHVSILVLIHSVLCVFRWPLDVPC